MCSIPLAMGILVTIYSCEMSLKPLARIKYYLHKIQRRPADKGIHRSIVRFSQQILSQKLVFNTNGFFDVNFDFLKGICASITVYLVIFVQFMPNDRIDVIALNATTNTHTNTTIMTVP